MIPKYKIHGVKEDGKYTVEYPATDDVLILIKQAAKCGREGFDAIVYVRADQ
jgi:hypothetical protein